MWVALAYTATTLPALAAHFPALGAGVVFHVKHYYTTLHYIATLLHYTTNTVQCNRARTVRAHHRRWSWQ